MARGGPALVAQRRSGSFGRRHHHAHQGELPAIKKNPESLSRSRPRATEKSRTIFGVVWAPNICYGQCDMLNMAAAVADSRVPLRRLPRRRNSRKVVRPLKRKGSPEYREASPRAEEPSE